MEGYEIKNKSEADGEKIIVFYPDNKFKQGLFVVFGRTIIVPNSRKQN